MNEPRQRILATRLRAVCAVACLLASVALAQRDTDAETLTECARIESAPERLACYDRLSAPAQTEAAPRAEAASQSATPPATPPATPNASRDRPVTEPTAGNESASPSSAVDTTAAAAAHAATAEPAAGRNRSDERGISSIHIVEVLKTGVGETYFRTDSGELYKQTSSERTRFPDAPFTTDLQPASRGSYFMSSPLGGPRVRVSLQD